MKDTRNLVITEKESYLTTNKAIAISSMLNNKYETPNTIEAILKNKWAIKFDELDMEESKYYKIKKTLQNLQLEIYIETEKHNNRRKKQMKNDKRMAEEIKINLETIRPKEKVN